MRAAAEHSIPVLLEFGGQNTIYVDAPARTSMSPPTASRRGTTRSRSSGAFAGLCVRPTSVADAFRQARFSTGPFLVPHDVCEDPQPSPDLIMLTRSTSAGSLYVPAAMIWRWSILQIERRRRGFGPFYGSAIYLVGSAHYRRILYDRFPELHIIGVALSVLIASCRGRDGFVGCRAGRHYSLHFRLPPREPR